MPVQMTLEGWFQPELFPTPAPLPKPLSSEISGTQMTLAGGSTISMSGTRRLIAVNSSVKRWLEQPSSAL